MTPKVTIIDYGVGNLFSITNAFQHCGVEISFTSEPAGVDAAEHLVLPGVGAFRKGMEGLSALGLVEPLRRYAERERPFLGICLGMQMMLDESEEFGAHKGLGFIPGKVKAIEPTATDGRAHKIPHIAWSPLMPSGAKPWKGTILGGVQEAEMAYFVHSYTPVPDNEAHRLADTFYDGRRLSAVIAKGHLYGTQFHPEKSGEAGLGILRAFLKL